MNHFRLRRRKNFVFGKVNLRTKFAKIGREIGTLSWTQSKKWTEPGVNWRACAFTTSGVIGHRTQSSLSDVWFMFQVWWRSDKNCGRYLGRYVFRTDRHTLKWFYICPIPCIALDREQDWLSIEGRPPPANKTLAGYLLLWPWPWPNDLDIQTRSR